MTKFAAYDDLSIYATANTAEAAIKAAREAAKEPSATFQTAPITDQFATWIEENGWDGKTRSFEIGRNGFILDTTNDR